MKVSRIISTARPAGRLYQFTWWFKAYAVLTLPIIVGLALAGPVLFAWLAIEEGPLGWIIAVPFFVWMLYLLTLFLSIFTPVVVAERSFHVRILLWWVEIPWQNVTDMRYGIYPFHVVYVRQRLPLRRQLGIQVFRWRESPVFLVVGLKHRKELFWEIWRRASHAQGREVLVRGARPPGMSH